eukprot:gene17832-27478_t
MSDPDSSVVPSEAVNAQNQAGDEGGGGEEEDDHPYHADGCRPLDLFVATPEDIVCPVGKGVMLDPVIVKTANCRHEVCSACLRKSEQAKGKVCPVCSEPYREDDIVPNRKNRLRVLELTAYCDHKEKGCPWEDKQAFLQDHLSECEHTKRLRCFFWMYGCKYSSSPTELDHHLLDQAQYHLQLTCQRLEAYGDNGEFAIKPTEQPVVKQSGGLSDGQCSLFVECIGKGFDVDEISAKFRERFDDTAWSVIRCLRADCTPHIESV